jgi:membrane-associated phospholipid phosphatase
MPYRAASVCILCIITVTPAPALAQESPFRSLFAGAAEDFTRLASKDTAMILSIGGIAAAAGHLRDRPVTDTMTGPAGWHDALGPGETIGGARMQAAGAVLAYTVGRAVGNQKLARVGGDLIRAQILTQTLTLTVKTAVGRTRPDGTQYSFPSGHSAVTFASATVLQRNLGWKAGVPAYAVASYVAASRIQAKRHVLSDVTFGAALGIVAGRTVTVGRGDRKFAVQPMATPGGAGVSFTLIR